MSRHIPATNGHVGVYAGGARGDKPSDRLVGLQVEDERGSRSLTQVRLTLDQARELGLELERSTARGELLACVKNYLEGKGFLP